MLDGIKTNSSGSRQGLTMTTYNYCPSCAYNLESPTPSEIILGFRRCKSCKESIPAGLDRDDLLLAMCDRIGELEDAILKLSQPVVFGRPQREPVVTATFNYPNQSLQQKTGFYSFDDDIPF